MNLIKWYLTIAAIIAVAIANDPIKPDAVAKKGPLGALESTHIANNTGAAK